MKRQFPVIVFILISIIGQADAQVIWQKITVPPTKIVGLQSSPNGKLFLMISINSTAPPRIYVSKTEGDPWFDESTYPAPFVIDSQGVLCAMKDTNLFTSFDEGVTWQKTPSTIYYPQFLVCTKDSLYVLSRTPTAYQTGDYGKTWDNLGYLGNGSDFDWSGAYISYSGKIFGALGFDNSLHLIRSKNNPKIQMPMASFDNSAPKLLTFDMDGYGYGELTDEVIRSLDDGLTWVFLDSVPNPNHFRVPYIPVMHNALVAVNDTISVLSSDHGNTWQKIGTGIPGISQRAYSYFVDRKGMAFIYTDTALYRMSLFASVHNAPSTIEDITVHFDPTLNQISLQSETSLGSTTASLYTIDGRLLKRTRLDISSPGVFSIDVSDMHTHFAILVLQTGRGVITKKILF